MTRPTTRTSRTTSTTNDDEYDDEYDDGYDDVPAEDEGDESDERPRATGSTEPGA